MRTTFKPLLLAVLVLSALAGGLAAPAPVRADEVAVAQARVERLRGLVDRTTAELTRGTREWQADQAGLRSVRLKLRNTRRHIDEAKKQAKRGEERVAALARRLYMTPGTDGLQLAFTRGPDEIIDALQVRGALNQAAGSDATIVRRAQAARVQLQRQELQVVQLETQAKSLVERSARRLAQLNALAQSTADQLNSAQNALQRARAAKAARERASRARRALAASGPACTGKSTSGQQNGNLDPASLCPLWRAPGHRLRADAAAAFNKMSQFHAATVGGALCVSDSYRSYSEQVDLYRRKPGLAAVPGTSEHGWGKAVDFCGGVQNSGSAAYQWMKANAGKFGWYHPDWAEPSGSKPEAWHWEFGG